MTGGGPGRPGRPRRGLGARFTVKVMWGGFEVRGPDGRRAEGPFAQEGEAQARAAALQAAEEARRGRRVRACLCCGGAFYSEGCHNRLCPACRRGGDGLPASFQFAGATGRRLA